MYRYPHPIVLVTVAAVSFGGVACQEEASEPPADQAPSDGAEDGDGGLY